MGYMKGSIKVMLADNITGECVSIGESKRSSIKALKQWVTRHLQNWEETDLVVIEAADENLKTYFENYIDKLTKLKK